MSGFFLWTILQKGSERCVLIDFDLQNYPSPVLWRWFSMYPRVSKLVSTTRLCNGHRQDVPSRRCCGEHRRSSRVITAGGRWQCSGLRCGRSSDSIAEETDSSPDPEEERQQHSCSMLLCCPSLWPPSSLTPLPCLSQACFFLAPRVTKRKEFPAVWLTAQRMRGVLTPRTRAESNIAECIDASLPPPFFFYSTTPYQVSGILLHYSLWNGNAATKLRETKIEQRKIVTKRLTPNQTTRQKTIKKKN